jgi:anti-sigma factor (TIGR02949 family)
MENCKEVFALLSQYLDRELPEDVCEQMSAHIEGCPPCVEFVASLKRTVKMCHEYRAVEGPAPLNTEAMERLLDAYRKVMAAST